MTDTGTGDTGGGDTSGGGTGGGDSGASCDTLDCAYCCQAGACVLDAYACKVDATMNFTDVGTLLIVIGSLIIGVPLVFFILDGLMTGKPFKSCAMSACEFVATYLCSCFCISKKFRTKFAKGEDRFSMLQMSSRKGKLTKGRRNKITPGMDPADNSMAA